MATPGDIATTIFIHSNADLDEFEGPRIQVLSIKF